MNSSNHHLDMSDDEIFIGKLTLKEVKKHIGIDTHRQTLPCATNDESDTSLKLVEVKSEPDICSSMPQETSTCGNISPNTVIADDSFLKLEKFVTDLESVDCNDGLDNTFEVVNFILKQGSSESFPKLEIPDYSENLPSDKNCEQKDVKNNILLRPLSPASQYSTPMKHSEPKNNYSSTPICKAKLNTPCFKTPSNSVSLKKPSTLAFKKTPSKNVYQHIASPVAAYIKNSPQVPLVKDIHPRKPLPGISSIPKLWKPKQLNSNKENMNLPTLAYKSAKTVKVIEVSQRDKLPQSHWAKKITSSVPKPMVLKHINREVNSAKKLIGSNQEDSFANLTMHQADVSVCTQKSAFNRLLSRDAPSAS